MKNYFHSVYDAAQGIKIQDISFDYLRPPGLMGREINLGEVEDAQPVAILKEFLGQSGTQISGSPRDQNIGQ
jgi:hypothetical protein